MKGRLGFVAGLLAGAVVAAGIVLFVVKRNQPAEPLATTVQAPAEVATPAPVTAEEPATPEKPSPAPVIRKKPVRKVAKQRPLEPAAPPAEVAIPKPEKEQPPAPPVETAKAAHPPEPAVEAPPPRIPHTATLPAGTLITVRLSETLSSEKNAAGDAFSATLDQPIVADGYVIAERGARVEGRVVAAEKAGRVKGVSQLGVQLVKFNSSDGQKLAIQTDTFQKEGPTTKKEDATKVGAAAAIGAAIGAIAGGGKGAAIGAAAGGAAGTGGVMATRGKPAELPVETKISFRLSEPVTITEKLR
jgi:hypothetical protein